MDFLRIVRLTWFFAAGAGSIIAEEGSAIYQIVEDKINETRGEFTHLEEAVTEQFDKPMKKKRKRASPKAARANSPGVADIIGGLPVNFDLDLDGSDSD